MHLTLTPTDLSDTQILAREKALAQADQQLKHVTRAWHTRTVELCEALGLNPRVRVSYPQSLEQDARWCECREAYYQAVLEHHRLHTGKPSLAAAL